MFARIVLQSSPDVVEIHPRIVQRSIPVRLCCLCLYLDLCLSLSLAVWVVSSSVSVCRGFSFWLDLPLSY